MWRQPCPCNFRPTECHPHAMTLLKNYSWTIQIHAMVFIDHRKPICDNGSMESHTLLPGWLFLGIDRPLEHANFALLAICLKTLYVDPNRSPHPVLH